ncbi:hypothetical protein ACU686_37255 [Yinghuangia aomiensis]
MRLDPGDILVGFSDGLIENRSRGITQGLDLLLDVARTASARGDTRSDSGGERAGKPARRHPSDGARGETRGRPEGREGREGERGLEKLLSSILERLLDGQDRDDDVTILGVRIAEPRGDVPGSAAHRTGPPPIQPDRRYGSGRAPRRRV